MALIVVGGQAKNVGKTTLLLNIMAAFPELRWSAVKITNHRHEPAGCELRADSASWSIWEQVSITGESDTCRFIQAGAQHAWLIQADDDALEGAYAALRRIVPAESNLIVESNRIGSLLDPDLFLLMIDAAQPEFKSSARQRLERIDAIVWRGSQGRFSGDAAAILTKKPSFLATKTELDPKLASLIRDLLGGD